MDDLFSLAPKPPLAELLRPKTLDEVIGQLHLLGPGRPLRLAFESGRPHSFVLWGPPGVGKTTLAQMAAKQMGCHFIALSAVSAGVKEIREAVERARIMTARDGNKTVLFVDEVHRFNKGQQDVLLPHVENGTVIFLGATTENPSWALNSALLSRALVYVLKPLEPSDLKLLYKRALASLDGVRLDNEALDFVVGLADGDARRFLNVLEQVQSAARNAGTEEVDKALVLRSTSDGVRRFDNGDSLYDTISALQKSIRGSSPDAALYWLARMIDGGADPKYIARRLVVMASEDIGNADPRALQVAMAASDAYHRLGSPEGDLNLAHAAVYLAMAPKSNAVYTAWNAARAFVKTDSTREVPLHLRNAPTQLSKDLGHHKGYRYAHDEPDAYAAGENYFPSGMATPNWYKPVDRGLEIKLAEKLAHLKSMDAASQVVELDPDLPF